MNSKSIAFVIPAFNEERTVAGVVKIALETGLGDVLVVSDGSVDQTDAVAQAAGARVERLEPNQGKGAAVLRGAHVSSADYLVMLDADLLSLEPDHILSMLEPIHAGRADTTAGLFSGGGLATDFGNRATPMWSGQRVIPRQTVLNTPNLERRGYGIELAINDQIAKEGLRLEYVNLTGVSQVLKEQKVGLLAGFARRLKMYWQIFSYTTRGRSEKQKAKDSFRP
jgi:glycosyltransferase involved in cell wall biosynthesis